MAEYDLPYDYFDDKYVPVCDVVSNRSTEDGENTKSLEETIMELSDHTTVSSDTHSSASRSGSGSAPSPQASFVFGSTTSTQTGSEKKVLAPKKPQPPQLPRPVPMERYDVRVRFPKQPQTGEIMRVNPGRKVRTLVDYLMSIIRRTEAQDTREGRNLRTSMSEQVKMAIMQAATGHLSAENFVRVIGNYVRVHDDRHFINFLKASFPRLSRRFLKGEVAIEPFVPLQTLYAKDFFNIPFDGHFLWGVYREYYDKLVQNGEAPPVIEQVGNSPQEYDLFDSDSESTIAAKSAAASEENSLVEQEPCRVFTGSLLDDTFINTDVLLARFKAILGDDVECEDEALLLISEAAQDRTQRLVDRVVDFAEHREMAASFLSAEFAPAPPSEDAARQVKQEVDVDSQAAENNEALDEEQKPKKKSKSETSKGKRRKNVGQKKAQKGKSKKSKKNDKESAAPTPVDAAAAEPDTPLAANDGPNYRTNDGPPSIRVRLRDLQMACRALGLRSTVAYKICIGPNLYPTATGSENRPASK
ncbi:hypothetical protein Y032_0268g783 [Ancylostoma ceylanicum]|uniref:Uncharacterized protein n=1 Tax=Ancylostoma ceylanicum TaxID=53326 RepID=A0A016S8Y4_9BILA|nr:hypothetical protein Y032_0268g783 [Ancylostoma ceylanicum]